MSRTHRTAAGALKAEHSHTHTHPVSAQDTDTLTREEQQVDFAQILDAESPWQVIVWNDPVNLMSYVAYIFRSYFGYTRARAEELMLAVHNNGKAIVFTGSKDEAQKHTSALHGYGLMATFEKMEG